MTTLQQDINATLVWPITQQGRQIAQRLAQAHTQASIAERVRRNTLAVWAVHDFLSTLGIATDPAGSDSWNPVLNLMEDIADLHLPGIGTIECRPVEPDTARCDIPLEAQLDRAGYVMVRLDETAGEATLLGFSAAQASAEIGLDHLQTMAALPDYLHSLATAQPNAITRLGHWLEGTVEAMWQSVDDLLTPQTLQPAFRQASTSPVEGLRRAKRLVLDPTTVVVLVVGVAAGQGEIELVTQLHPNRTGDAPPMPQRDVSPPHYLPEGITMEIVDATGTVVLMARSKATDNALQMAFSGQPGEAFSLQIGWQSTYVTERFVI